MNETEREIVAWLREQSKECRKDGYPEDSRTLFYAAKAIERGEHRQNSPAKDD